MKRILLCVFLVPFLLPSYGQLSRYLVSFTDKGNSSFSLANPSQFLSARAIERKLRHQIAIDSADLPVTKRYIDSLRAIPNVTVLNTSKWLNQVSIQTSDINAINKINQLPFVKSSRAIASKKNASGIDDVLSQKNETVVSQMPDQTLLRTTTIAANRFNYGAQSLKEITLHNGEFLHNIGLQGQNMVIAMLDAGFFNYNILKAMDSIVANGQVLSTWDFVNRETNVANDHPHGMQCLSTIAANIPGQFVGKAPKANFHLFVTEDVYSEYPIEEFNWVCGAERADSAGSDIISSSVGYYHFDDPLFNYSYAQMDGNTTISARGADIAAKKGLLVFNSAGNEGGNSWKYIITPADADSIVAVGSVNTSGVPAGSSSYGPSADGQVKPTVASVGVNAVVQATNNTIGTSSGTSFACPNMAGLATCLWQAFPEFNNMKIIDVLKRASDKYTSPDDRTGYGIPDMRKAFGLLVADYATMMASADQCNVQLTWRSRDVQTMTYELERKDPGSNSYARIAQVSGKGNTLQTNNYQFTDILQNAPAGSYTYRIRQVTDTVSKSFVYIDSATITTQTPCSTIAPGKIVHLYPNPVGNEHLNVWINTPEAIAQLSIQVTDMLGRILYQVKTNKPAGNTLLNVPVHNLPDGVYKLSVLDGNKRLQATSFIKSR